MKKCLQDTFSRYEARRDLANHVFQECEQGIGGKNSPTCYIPKKGPVQEALEKN